MAQVPFDALLTPDDVAKLLGVSGVTVRRYVQDGLIKCIYVGRTASGKSSQRRMRFLQSHVTDFINKRLKR